MASMLKGVESDESAVLEKRVEDTVVTPQPDSTQVDSMVSSQLNTQVTSQETTASSMNENRTVERKISIRVRCPNLRVL